MKARLTGIVLALVSTAVRAKTYPTDRMVCGSAFILEYELHAGVPDMEHPPNSVTPTQFCFLITERFARWEVKTAGKPTATWTLDRQQDRPDGSTFFAAVSKAYDEESLKGIAQSLSAHNAEKGAWYVTAIFSNLDQRKMWNVGVMYVDGVGFFSDKGADKRAPVAPEQEDRPAPWSRPDRRCGLRPALRLSAPADAPPAISLNGARASRTDSCRG